MTSRGRNVRGLCCAGWFALVILPAAIGAQEQPVESEPLPAPAPAVATEPQTEPAADLEAEIETLKAENQRLRDAAQRPDNSAALKAAHTKNDELRAALEQAQRDLQAARSTSAAQARPARPEDDAPIENARPPERKGRTALLVALCAALALAGGFWWGYRTLERRVRRKYGGLKVY